MSGETVTQWLMGAGLEQHVNKFQGVDPDKFRALLMQDYAKYGIKSLEDKQKLFRLVKSLQFPADMDRNELEDKQSAHRNVDAKHTSSSQEEEVRKQIESSRNAVELLDLEAEDDLLDNVSLENGLCAVSPDVAVKSSAGEERHMSQQGVNRMPASAPNVAPQKIKVCVRKRPLNKREKDRHDDDIMEVQQNCSSLIVYEPKQKVDLTRYTERHEFHFDSVFDLDVSNDSIYKETVMPMLPVVYAGGRASCFAFGQTGSGKTYTMNPLPPRCAMDMFDYLSSSHKGMEMTMSVYEIYGSKVCDLLNGRNQLVMREDGRKNVNVVGLQEKKITTVEEVQQYLSHAASVRSTGCTGANSESSRSHCITSFALRMAPLPKSNGYKSIHNRQPATPFGKVIGKISFIDLAGSERGADTYDNDKQTRMEGAQINKSLLALKECIRALDQDAKHIPFRGSKLTEVLRDSFTGQSVSVMIANIAPSASCCENSLNTLRYADRVKEMKRDRSNSIPFQEHRSTSMVAQSFDHKQGKHAPAAQPKSNASLPQDGKEVVKNRRKSSNLGMLKDSNKENRIMNEDKEAYMNVAEKADFEEELVISAHKQLIEQTMDFVRTEMALLADVDQPGSSIHNYVADLNQILSKHMAGIAAFQKKLSSFESTLKNT